MPLALSATVNQSIHTAVPPPLPAPLINQMPNGNEHANHNGTTNGNLSDSSKSNGTSINGVAKERIVNGQKPIRKPPSRPRVWPSDSDLKNDGMKNGGEVNANHYKEMNGKPPVRPPIRPTKMNAPLATNGVTAKLVMRSNSARSLDSNNRVKSSPKPITNGNRPISASLRLPVSRGSTPDSSLKSYSRESSIISRSPSPSLNSTLNSISSISSSRGSYTERLNDFRRSLTPRRVFPQHYFNENPMDINEMHHLEQSSVIFDANLQFVLGCQKQRVHQAFRASPAHSEKETASNYLSDKINEFLQRTDHISEEWKLLGKRTIDDDTVSMIERQRKEDRQHNIITKSKSAANIMIKGFQLISKQPRTPITRSNSIARDDIDDDQCTIVDASEVCVLSCIC